MAPHTKTLFQSLGGFVAFVVAISGLALFVARSTAAQEVRALELRQASSEAEQAEKNRAFADSLHRIDENVRAARRQTEALCRATPRAQCPYLE